MISPPLNIDDRRQQITRRWFFRECGIGLGSIALSSLLSDKALASPGPSDPLAPKRPHFPGKAKRVIFLYMSGGVSHVDSFDPKPRLREEYQKGNPRYLPALWDFKPRGRSGIEVSELFPQIAECVDDL